MGISQVVEHSFWYRRPYVRIHISPGRIRICREHKHMCTGHTEEDTQQSKHGRAKTYDTVNMDKSLGLGLDRDVLFFYYNKCISPRTDGGGGRISGPPESFFV